MTLVHTFQQLHEMLHKLGAETQVLHITVTEDRPPHNDVAVADLYGDTLEEIVGRLGECVQEIAPHLPTVDRPPTLGLWYALAHCQSNFGDLEFRCFDLLSYSRLAPLIQLGRRRGGEWQGWATSVRSGLESLPPLLFDIQRQFTICWQALGEQSGPPKIVIQDYRNRP